MKWWLVILILLAAGFSFWHLGRPDIITDESSIATRAIGMVDFDFGIEQPTPWQWVQGLPPWWMRLSFHDHPPLVFLLQHFSMRLFGQTPFAIRLPSVLAGLAAVWLVYLIGKQLYSPSVGLVSAAIFAFTANHVWISRIGLQESVLIALMLASAYFFLKAYPPSVSIDYPIGTDDNGPKKGNRRSNVWLYLASFSLGLAFLAKYNALILIPIFASFFAMHHAANKAAGLYLRSNLLRISIAALIFLAVASPIIIYNIQLYRNFGHFDFQFSLLAGQNVPEWQARPGQEVLGSYSNRLKTYFPRLIEANSPYFLALATIGLAIILAQMIFRKRFFAYSSFVVSHSSLVITLVWLLLFLIFIGPAHRFFTMLTPWLAIAAGYGVMQIYNHRISLRFGKLTLAAFVILIFFEMFYSYNSVIALDPVGPKPWIYSYLHRQSLSSGFNELNVYLDNELENKMPETAIAFEFPFARQLLKQAMDRGRSQNAQSVPWGIVYNDNINLSAQLWVLLRRITYNGWPVASAENFIAGGGQEFLRSSGVRSVIFVNATPAALQDRTRLPTPDGNIIEDELKAQGLSPVEIKNPKGEVAFRAYEFELR